MNGNKKKDPITLKEGITALLDAYRLNGKLDEATVIASWEKIMGALIAKKTEKIAVRDGVIFLKIASTALKHELRMSKDKMIDLINKDLGRKVIVDIKLY